MLAIIAVTLLLLVAGCGGDEETETRAAATPRPTATMDPDAPAKDGGAKKRDGIEIVLGDSQFGDILFDAGEQAIYVFERDSRDETRCYGECADAWPPVYTDGEPVAGDGLDARLLGTIERRDGRMQVTYDGRPLYYYAHERPGEVKCQNVNLNGGLWWVVGADGQPLS